MKPYDEEGLVESIYQRFLQHGNGKRENGFVEEKEENQSRRVDPVGDIS
jgi:hypothetical protein